MALLADFMRKNDARWWETSGKASSIRKRKMAKVDFLMVYWIYVKSFSPSFDDLGAEIKCVVTTFLSEEVLRKSTPSILHRNLIASLN